MLALRGRIELVADEGRKTFEGCSVVIDYDHGSSAAHNVDNFLGTPGNPVPDAALAEIFHLYAAQLPDGRADAIVAAVWGLDECADVRGLTRLLRNDE